MSQFEGRTYADIDKKKSLLREKYGLMGEELTRKLRKLTYNGFIRSTFEQILLE